MDHGPFGAVRPASGTTEARVLFQLRFRRRFLRRFYDFTVNMQSKWPSRAQNAVPYGVLERPKIWKNRAKVARMLVNRRFCMFILL